MKVVLINDQPINGITMGHSQSNCEFRKNKIYEVEQSNTYIDYKVNTNRTIYYLKDDTGKISTLEAERFMILSEYREQRIEEILA